MPLWQDHIGFKEQIAYITLPAAGTTVEKYSIPTVILRKRKRDIARKIAIYLAIILVDSTISEIGKKFGISPTGVSMAVKRIEAVIKTDKRLKRKVEKFIKKQNIA